MIDELLNSHTKIFRAVETLKYFTTDTCALYYLPDKQVKIWKVAGAFVLSVGNRYRLIPYEDMSTQRFLSLVLDLLAKDPKAFVEELPFAYRNALRGRGYVVEKDTFENHSFIYSTQYLLSVLEEGSPHKELRRLNKRFLAQGGYYRLLGPEDLDSVVRVEVEWERAYKNLHGEDADYLGYASTIFSMMNKIPSEWECKAVGAFSSSGELMGFSIGSRVSESQWGCLFRHGARGQIPYANLSWLHLVPHYGTIPYENDGNGATEGLYFNKSRFLSEDVADKQVYLGYVRNGR